jgi:hypothetical protein
MSPHDRARRDGEDEKRYSLGLGSLVGFLMVDPPKYHIIPVAAGAKRTKSK